MAIIDPYKEELNIEDPFIPKTGKPTVSEIVRASGATKMLSPEENVPTEQDTLGEGSTTAGALFGGRLGMQFAGPWGGLVGAGLGAASGGQFVDILRGRKRTLPDAATKSVQDFNIGAGSEVLGGLMGKGIEKLMAAGKNYSPSLYESALKPSTVLSNKEVKKRVLTGLKEGVPVSEKGLSKSVDTIRNINKEISNRINSVSGIELSKSVETDKALGKVANLSESVYSKDITPRSDMVKIAKYIDEIQTTKPEFLTLKEAQGFKQTLNKQLNEYYDAVKKGKANPGAINAKIKSAMADGLRTEITEVFPELKGLNQREGSLIELNKSLGRAVNRIKNREIIPLLSGLAFSVSSVNAVAKALLVKAIEHPEVKSKLAIALYKSNPAIWGSVAKAGAQSAVVAGMEE